MSYKWDMSIKVWHIRVSVSLKNPSVISEFYAVLFFLLLFCCFWLEWWTLLCWPVWLNRCWGWRHGRCFECRELALGRRPRTLLGRQVVQIRSPRSSTAPGTLNLRYLLYPRPLWRTPAVCSWFKTNWDTVGHRTVFGLAAYASGSANVSLLARAFLRIKTHLFSVGR